MITKMEELKDRIAAILGGSTFGLFGGIKIWQSGINNLYWEFPLKMAGTVILAVVGGLTGLLVKDLYQHRIKHWWVKKIKKDKIE